MSSYILHSANNQFSFFTNENKEFLNYNKMCLSNNSTRNIENKLVVKANDFSLKLRTCFEINQRMFVI